MWEVCACPQSMFKRVHATLPPVMKKRQSLSLLTDVFRAVKRDYLLGTLCYVFPCSNLLTKEIHWSSASFFLVPYLQRTKYHLKMLIFQTWD